MKVCPRCKEEKPDEDFSWKSKPRGTRTAYCKPCARDYAKEHYKGDKGGYKARTEKSRARNRERLREYKLGLSCMRCGEGSSECLDFHHIDPSVKVDSVSNLFLTRASPVKGYLEIKKCIVLCANCHRKLHAGNAEVSAWYSHLGYEPPSLRGNLP